MDLSVKIKQFLNNPGTNKGYGSGNGNGSGYGSGYGYGYGNGNGYGNGYGIKSINGYDVYIVDGISTVFTQIHGNVAKGYILEQNVNLKPCCIVKGNGYFAHGATLREAQNALEKKVLDDMDVEEKIDMFIEKFGDKNKKYPAMDFFQWHHNLTGSCEMGRNAFVKNHNIDIEHDEFTVEEFIELTENAYGGDAIRQLKERLKKGEWRNEQ